MRKRHNQDGGNCGQDFFLISTSRSSAISFKIMKTSCFFVRRKGPQLIMPPCLKRPTMSWKQRNANEMLRELENVSDEHFQTVCKMFAVVYASHGWMRNQSPRNNQAQGTQQRERDREIDTAFFTRSLPQISYQGERNTMYCYHKDSLLMTRFTFYVWRSLEKNEAELTETAALSRAT